LDKQRILQLLIYQNTLPHVLMSYEEPNLAL